MYPPVFLAYSGLISRAVHPPVVAEKLNRFRIPSAVENTTVPVDCIDDVIIATYGLMAEEVPAPFTIKNDAVVFPNVT